MTYFENSPLCRKFIGSFMILGIISVLCASISFIIFTIIGLVDSKPYIYDKCHNSFLWYYSLTALVVSTIIGTIAPKFHKNKTNSIKICAIIIEILITTCIMSWGMHEIWGVSCVGNLNEGKTRILYITSNIMVILELGSIIINIGGICYLSRKNDNSESYYIPA